MKTVIELAEEAGFEKLFEDVGDWVCFTDEIERFAELVRADERGRMCEQLKECSNENSTSNETNRSTVLGEGGQAN